MQAKKKFKYPKEVRKYFAERNRKARAKKQKEGVVSDQENYTNPSNPTDKKGS